VQAIESVVELRGRAKIKWVNDILIDRAKVCGVLAYTQTEGLVVNNVVLGIGMNVEAKPRIKTTPFVPETACLCDLANNKSLCRPKVFFDGLIKHLALNYNRLIAGEFSEILNLYREYSCVIDRQVEVYPDAPEDSSGETSSGIVAGIGENLEIYLRGQSAPITRGRLVLKSFK
jgi:biotin-(acetyl-CoA carboxylase) ligase